MSLGNTEVCRQQGRESTKTEHEEEVVDEWENNRPCGRSFGSTFADIRYAKAHL